MHAGYKLLNLTVTETNPIIKEGEEYYECLCVCKEKVWISLQILANKLTSSCGCSKNENLAGRLYGYLTIVSVNREAYETNTAHSSRGTRWNCVCQCGKEKIIFGYMLRNKRTTSCGCAQKEFVKELNLTHGKSNITEYGSWRAMHSRCYNPQFNNYDHYGGRGIKVCERWHDINNFIADMGPRLGIKMSLDRIDTDGDYSPENCRWATVKQQQNNKRNNNTFLYKGEFKTIAELAEIAGIKYNTMFSRLTVSKWSVDKAVSAPRANTYLK